MKKSSALALGGTHQSVTPRTVNSQQVMTYWGIDYSEKKDLMLIAFNFDKNGWLYSVDFYEPNDFKAIVPGATAKAALSIFSNGNSAALLLPVVVEVLKTRNFKLDDEKAKQIAKDEIYGKSTEESEQV